MSPQPFAQDRLTLLLSLVPYLMEHEDGVTVAETAAHFDVGEDEVRRAVRMIAVSGVPGETLTYQANDLFDIDWDAFESRNRIILTNLVAIDDAPRFSAREAAALIAGLQYLQSIPENTDRGAVATLMAKLTRAASGEPTSVAVESADGADASLRALRDAVARGVQLVFDYRGARGERERRRVDPLQLELVDGTWYLRGWCHLREATRTFRLDRIEALTVTDDPVSPGGKDAAVPDTLFEASADDLAVELRIATTALPLVADYLTPGDVVRSDGDGFVRATIRVAHFHGLKRLVASLAGVVTVTSPREARAAVADWAQSALARYGVE